MAAWVLPWLAVGLAILIMNHNHHNSDKAHVIQRVSEKKCRCDKISNKIQLKELKYS